MRSAFSAAEMRRLLEARRFTVRTDRDGLERAQRWSKAPTFADRMWVRFHHVVVADFVGRPGGGATG
jgi:hypothetical protein